MIAWCPPKSSQQLCDWKRTVAWIWLNLFNLWHRNEMQTRNGFYHCARLLPECLTPMRTSFLDLRPKTYFWLKKKVLVGTCENGASRAWQAVLKGRPGRCPSEKKDRVSGTWFCYFKMSRCTCLSFLFHPILSNAQCLVHILICKIQHRRRWSSSQRWLYNKQ